MKKYLAIDVGGSFTKYAVMDENCVFYNKGKVPTEYETDKAFLEMLVNIFANNNEGVEGIAISTAGVIDCENGIMRTGGSLATVLDFPIVEKLEKECGLFVTVENDAKCAALAEVWKGSLQGTKDAMVMILGTAVGGAVIVDGKLLKGNHLLAGEFSYLFTDTQDACNEEKLLALQGGVPALIRLTSEALHVPAESLNGEKIFEMAKNGNSQVIECVRRYAHTLAVQITNYQFITDPEKVAIGGGISEQPMLLDMIREELIKVGQTFPHKMPVPKIVPCSFFNDSNLIGALYVHLIQKNKGLKE